MKYKNPFKKRNMPLTRRVLVQTFASSPLLFFVKPSFGQSSDEVNSIIKDLAPIDGQIKAGGKYKPIRPETYTWQGQSYCVAKEKSRDFEVYFDFDSARITPRARDQLQDLGRALEKLASQNSRHIFAGHTDRTGDYDYNMRLSYERAEAVADYLVSNFAIDPYRIKPVGFGYTRLKTPGVPYAAINRRVEVSYLVDDRTC